MAPERPLIDSAARAVVEPPTLWHLKVSNYNEKVRWALDYKRIAHRRRAAVPGPHRRVAMKLTGEPTFPVLVVRGRAVGDSTRIIAALERDCPRRSLYGADAAARSRALAIEDMLDEHLGTSARLLFLHHALPDAELLLGAFAPDLRPFAARAARTAFPLIRRRVLADFGIDRHSVEAAYATLDALGCELRRRRRPSGYLVEDSFTVADLTLAALLSPVVAPEQFPYPQPQRAHPLLAPLRAALHDVGLLDWTEELYARHRSPSAEISPDTR